MRVGVVATASGDGWAELPLVVRRVCGALACHFDVTLLLAGPEPGPETVDGAVRVLALGATPSSGRSLLALERAFFGPDPEADGSPACECADVLRRELAAELPLAAQEQVLATVGGDSAALFAHLASVPYDVVVFAGAATASTYGGLQAVAGRCRTIVLAGAVDEALLWMPVIGQILESADGVMVTGAYEADLVARRAPGSKAAIHDVGFVLQVAELSVRTPPFGFDGGVPTVVVAADWNEPWRRRDRVVARATRLHRDLAGRAQVRFVGPGIQRLPRWGRSDFASSRIDAWRWMARAVAVVDPEPHRLIGRVAVESLLFATPVVVPANGGASRHHAEAGDGGLWYRGYEEMLACVEALLDDDVSSSLAEQGRAYATERYCDTERFVSRVGWAVAGLAGAVGAT